MCSQSSYYPFLTFESNFFCIFFRTTSPVCHKEQRPKRGRDRDGKKHSNPLTITQHLRENINCVVEKKWSFFFYSNFHLKVSSARFGISTQMNRTALNSIRNSFWLNSNDCNLTLFPSRENEKRLCFPTFEINATRRKKALSNWCLQVISIIRSCLQRIFTFFSSASLQSETKNWSVHAHVTSIFTSLTTTVTFSFDSHAASAHIVIG